jgi:hypothetical protein
MPTIPIQRQLLSTDVPGASINPSAGSAIPDAIANLGGQVADTSLKMLGQIKKAEAQDASSSAHNDDAIESEKYMTQLKLSSPDGKIRDESGVIKTNPDGTPISMTQAYRNWANDRFTKNQLAMPSAEAQQLYKERAAPFFSSQVGAAFAEEQNAKLQSVRFNGVQRDQSRADSLTTYSTPRKVYDTSQQSRLDIQQMTGANGVYNQNQANEQMLKNDQQFAESAGKFAVNQVVALPKKGDKAFARQKIANQWIAYLTEDPNNPSTLSPDSAARKGVGLPILSEMFSPDTKATILHQLIAAREQADNFDVGALRASFQEAEAAFSLNKRDRVNLGTLGGQLTEGIKSGKIQPYEGAQMLGGLAMTDQVQKLPNAIVMLPPAEREKQINARAGVAYKVAQSYLANAPGTSQFGSLAEKQAKDKAEAINKQYLDESQGDWASFMANHETSTMARNAALAKSNTTFTDPRTLAGKGALINENIRSSELVFSSHFPNNPEYFRVITKPQSEQIAQFLTSPTNSPEATASAVRTMAKELGPNYPRVIMQMVQDKNLEKKWMFASLFGNSQTQTEDVIAALKSPSSSQQFKDFAASRGLTESQINAEIGSKFGKFVLASSQQSPGDPFSQMGQEAIFEAAKSKAMANLQSGRASDWGPAVQQAYDSLVGNNWYVKEARGQGGILGFGQRKYNLVVPKTISGRPVSDQDAQSITDYAQSIMTPDALKKMGAVPPPTPKGQPSQFPEEFYKQVANDDGRVVVNQKLGGLEVWYFDRYHNTNKQVTMKGADGKQKALLIPLQNVLNQQPTQATSPLKKFTPGGNQ